MQKLSLALLVPLAIGCASAPGDKGEVAKQEPRAKSPKPVEPAEAKPEPKTPTIVMRGNLKRKKKRERDWRYYLSDEWKERLRTPFQAGSKRQAVAHLFKNYRSAFRWAVALQQAVKIVASRDRRPEFAEAYRRTIDLLLRDGTLIRELELNSRGPWRLDMKVLNLVLDIARKQLVDSPPVVLDRSGEGRQPDATAAAPARGRPAKTASTSQTVGSGFIVATGYAVTNAHVVGSSAEVQVELFSGRKLAGTVLARDEALDLAVVRVPASEPALTLAFDPQPGRDVYAYGFGSLGGTNSTLLVTRGAVSAVPASAARFVFDAKVNPGNSGGPLVDARGRVLGVVTMKTKSGDFVESLGIAVHAHVLRNWLNRHSVELRMANYSASAASAEARDQVRKSVVRIVAGG